MELWQRSLEESIISPAQLAGRFHLDNDDLDPVVAKYPMRIPPHYLRLIHEVGDPIWRQCVPDPRELTDNQHVDPLNEIGLSPVPGLIHRYPDRAVWIVSSQCAVYCRFCMRKGRVCCPGKQVSAIELKGALDYIAGHPAIRDVILSGGDPLLLEDEQLDAILTGLGRITHVEIVRIGTRVPLALPERVTAKLCRMLKRHHPLYINMHFNHPREINEASIRACNRLADAGIPLGNQAVLLKGVNDDPAVMKRLMQQLLAIRVRPYYIHQMDLVRGTGHFRTRITRGIEIIEALRGHTSGLATPHYVIDLPGGKGKVPIFPECMRWEQGEIILRNYQGEEIHYKETGSVDD
jgi:lysine 2,3-aminomutase